VRWLLTLIVALALFTTGCTTRQAQTAMRTSFDAAMEGVVAGDQALADAAQGNAGSRARARAEERCGGTCTNLTDLVLEELRPWEQALTGLQHARATLYLADDLLELWIDTGTLPDFVPVCGDVEDAFVDLVALLTAVGVDVPAAVGEVGPHVSTACEILARYVSRERED
jgi:hypothetical protein